jgi:3(or 17)beta-hydroxysteroid dehydrogenase
MCSMLGLIGRARAAGYCAAKGGVRLLTKSVALHCAHSRYHVRCNSVHPTNIRTVAMDAHVAAQPDPDAAREKYTHDIPIGRMGEADEVAAMVVYLASDESSLSTGSEFVVDGGQTAG